MHYTKKLETRAAQQGATETSTTTLTREAHAPCTSQQQTLTTAYNKIEGPIASETLATLQPRMYLSTARTLFVVVFTWRMSSKVISYFWELV